MLRRLLLILLLAPSAFAAVVRDVSYGPAAAQRFDVYTPEHARNAPILMMVHGGGWRIGDKSGRAVVDNKRDHWTKRGWIFISVNYRLLPEAAPEQQAADVRAAFQTVQRRAAEWGGDPHRIVLMGHSAGAHLVVLIAAQKANIKAAVILDSAALNVPELMRRRHAPLYDDAFGDDAATWRKLSPYHALTKGAPPLMLICSTKRRTSCAQANDFAARARELAVQATVREENLSHREINETLGEDSAYTRAVDAFLNALR